MAAPLVFPVLLGAEEDLSIGGNRVYQLSQIKKGNASSPESMQGMYIGAKEDRGKAAALVQASSMKQGWKQAIYSPGPRLKRASA